MDRIHPLKAYRERQVPPLTQEQLADRLGVSKACVSRWETGERKPEPEDLPGISEKIGIPPAVMRPDLAKIFASPSTRDGPGRPSASVRAKSRAA